MAEKHDLEIIITPDGQIKMEVKGMKGPACLSTLKSMADKLGVIKSEELRSEYYEQPSNIVKKQNRT